ncbi:MAG: S8 family serine peptidase, partial [Bacillota bacterium]|nr:S8 family serine peptidase [Bacillota bacterium]
YEGEIGANVREAWKLIDDPNPVTIAVIDSGCDMTHEDLSENLITDLAYDAVAEQVDGVELGDNSGHGTHVAGIAGAVVDNGKGVAGASDNMAKILPINVFSGSYASTDSIIKAMNYLDKLMANGTLKDLHVINMSLGGYEAEEGDEALFECIDYMRKKDVLTVCAGGNGNYNNIAYGPEKTIFPGDYEGCLCVAALDSEGNHTRFSDYNSFKDISAPGDNIYSTTMGSNYGFMSGTSMASPLVAGIASMLWAQDQNITVDQAIESIQKTAHPVNRAKYDRTGKTGSAGAIDAAAALEYAELNYDSSRIKIDEAKITLSQVEFTYTGQ